MNTSRSVHWFLSPPCLLSFSSCIVWPFSLVTPFTLSIKSYLPHTHFHSRYKRAKVALEAIRLTGTPSGMRCRKPAKQDEVAAATSSMCCKAAVASWMCNTKSRCVTEDFYPVESWTHKLVDVFRNLNGKVPKMSFPRSQLKGPRNWVFISLPVRS